MEESSTKRVDLDEIFGTDNHYRIPNYQRPYSWTNSEAGTFYDDIYDAWQYPASDNYFLGSIVLAHDGKNRYEVIDGQQRLTTISLLLSALYVCCQQEKVKDEIVSTF